MRKVDDPLRKLVEAWHSGTLRPNAKGMLCGRAACVPASYASRQIPRNVEMG